MKQRHILKGLFIVFAMMMTVKVAKADVNIYAFGAPIGTTTYEEFSNILEDKGFVLDNSKTDMALYKGEYKGRKADVFVLYHKGNVETVTIDLKEIHPFTAGQLYAELTFSIIEEYPTFQYETQDKDDGMYSIFKSGDKFIALTLKNNSSNSEISIIYSLDEITVDVEEEQVDDTFEPDFNSENNFVLPPKDMKGGDWGVSDEFMTKPGKTGRYWFPKMRVLCCPDGKYLLTIMRPASNGYFKVREGDDCYLRLENDSIVTLKLNTIYSPWNYEMEGSIQYGVELPVRYFTQTFYDIEDISQLSNNNIVKVRWIEDNKPYDIDYKENKWAKTFNKSFHDAILQATRKQREKSDFKEDKLSGF